MHRVTPRLPSLTTRLIVRSATTAMTNANVFLRGERRARLYAERLCKVERRKWENIAGVPVTMRGKLLSDGCKTEKRKDREREREGSRWWRAVSDHYLIRSAVSEMEPLINIIYDVNSAAGYPFRGISS